jgi:hypothetical protein
VAWGVTYWASEIGIRKSILKREKILQISVIK